MSATIPQLCSLQTKCLAEGLGSCARESLHSASSTSSGRGRCDYGFRPFLYDKTFHLCLFVVNQNKRWHSKDVTKFVVLNWESLVILVWPFFWRSLNRTARLIMSLKKQERIWDGGPIVNLPFIRYADRTWSRWRCFLSQMSSLEWVNKLADCEGAVVRCWILLCVVGRCWALLCAVGRCCALLGDVVRCWMLLCWCMSLKNVEGRSLCAVGTMKKYRKESSWSYRRVEVSRMSFCSSQVVPAGTYHKTDISITRESVPQITQVGVLRCTFCGWWNVKRFPRH